MTGLPVNRKCGRSAPEFAHTLGYRLLLSLTFSALAPNEIFTFISLSLSEISPY
jgi:hypothetical protein